MGWLTKDVKGGKVQFVQLEEEGRPHEVQQQLDGVHSQWH
jgi:hypothetical protein